MPLKIISGGQTGVDRAALDAALELGIVVGGWCPAGRRAEDGLIDARYPLEETATSDYTERTVKNVSSSDGTLILTRGPLEGGSALTHDEAVKAEKPMRVVDLDEDQDLEELARWLAQSSITTLNVSGPRESEAHGIYHRAYAFLADLFGRSKDLGER